ncbi:Zinc finger protein 12 [Collichthys lucidus]|uniref:Zinc finger protein 12 n=1 Tax=Collichthys lucidus TaxID=240159 RepID=A0A4U5V4L4_COLLU|nr:Zinc finger protein 12 [Collichthys lucidus]
MNGVKVEEEEGGEDAVEAEGTVPDTPSTPGEPAPKPSSRQSKRRHCCSVCGREFCRPSRLLDHMATHSGDKPHSCSVCGKRFTKKINVTVHQRVHTGEKPYSCPDCGLSYAQLGCLRRHRLRHAAEKPHRCSVCGRGFIQRRHLVQHERTHTGERPFSCPLCPKRFASRTGLSDHQKTHGGQNLYSCSFCEKVFSTPSSFRDHVRLHTGQKPHPCSLCCKSFNRPGLLRKHLQRHAAEKDAIKPKAAASEVSDSCTRVFTLITLLLIKQPIIIQQETPHRCFLCHKDFSAAEKLQQHLHYHQAVLQCDICDRGFTRASRLNEHVRSHTGERPFQCDVCKKRFSMQRVFRKHQEIHSREGRHAATATPHHTLTDEPLSDDDLSGLKVESTNEDDEEDAVHSLTDGGPDGVQKLHRCSVCGKSYPRPSRLREHFKVHATERLHRCTVCTKAFSTITNLRAHEKIHMAHKPHPCSICSKSFLRPCLLRKHMRIHIRDGLITDPADQEFWLNMKTEDEDEEDEEDAGLNEQDSEDLLTSTESFPIKSMFLPGNHGDQDGVLLTEDGEEREEGDVSGLINSDGEEEDWRPALIGQDGRPEKTFKQQSSLKSHQLTHSGVRYQCPLCSKSFSRALELTYHVDVHSDTRPYFCNICKKNLSGARIFRNHMKKHEASNSPLLRATPEDVEDRYHGDRRTLAAVVRLVSRSESALLQRSTFTDTTLQYSSFNPDTELIRCSRSEGRIWTRCQPNVHNTTTLLLSNDGSTLYVGARDALLSLDVSQSDVINLKKKVDCPNFVRVLQPLNSTHLYACGSHAYSPHDAYIDTESFSMIDQRDGAKGRCPFSPFQRNTALTVDGELFTATTSDFRGAKPQISRHFSRGRSDVSQDVSLSLLEEPSFVSSALDPSDRKLYFFFKSAVCVFRLQDMRTAFAGRYRTFDTQTHQWSPMLDKRSYLGKCGLDNVSDSVLAEVKKSFLTSNSIKPDGLGPIVVSSEHRYSRVAVMRTRAANNKHYTVLFLLTESGFIHKVVLFDGGAQVVEEIQVFTQPQLVKSVVLSTSKGVLYVGSSEGITAVPVARAQDLEHANVEEQCQGQPEPGRDREISVHLNEAVKLPCLKPSNVAALSWTSPRIKDRTEKLFIQSADGALSFFATADTFGTYHCEAEEGGYKEVIVSYDVRQVASPRAMSPIPDSESHPPIGRDESYEDIVTNTTRASAEPEDIITSRAGDFTTFVKEVDPVKDSTLKTDSEDEKTDATTSTHDVQFRKEQLDDLQTLTKEKSYHTELVVVSLLLTTCICILTVGGLHMWRHRKLGLKTNVLESPRDDSRISQSMESVPSLSSPEDPELKVVE